MVSITDPLDSLSEERIKDEFDFSEVPEKFVIDPAIVEEIMENYDKNKAIIEDYRKSKIIRVQTSHTLEPVEDILFNMIRPVLISILGKIEVENSFHAPKTSFNGLDHISEYCYNCNPRYPERKKSWTYIFDIDWVQQYLLDNPRPYYPLSRLMSKDTAATYIQAHLRGYWVRRRKDLEEIRQFWKTIEIKQDASGRWSSYSKITKSIN